MTTPAPEPVEAPADELAAAERPDLVEKAERELHAFAGVDPFRPLEVAAKTVLVEYERRGSLVEKLSVDICQVAHGASRIREENEAARRMLADERAANESYRADLARALPVVEAAGAVVAEFERHDRCVVAMSMDTEVSTGLLDALARAVRAAREPRTGEGT